MAYPDSGNVLLRLEWWSRLNDQPTQMRIDDYTLNMAEAEEGWSFGLSLINLLAGQGDIQALDDWFRCRWTGVEYRLFFVYESDDECVKTTQRIAELSHPWHAAEGAPYQLSPKSLVVKLGFDKDDAKVVDVRGANNDVGAEAVVHVDGWALLVRESRALESVIRVGRVSR